MTPKRVLDYERPPKQSRRSLPEIVEVTIILAIPIVLFLVLVLIAGVFAS